MFNFFSRSGPKTPDLSFLGADMHSHLLPGLDDGLQDVHQSVSFIRQLEQLGYSKLICTPHILGDVYKNSRETILPKLEILKNELLESGSLIRLEASAEYMLDIYFEKLMQEKNNLLLFGGKYILLEMSFMSQSQNLERIIFDLKMMDIQPIIAHPERYNYYHHQYDRYERLIDLGCYLQLNLLSMAGYYGTRIKKIAERLIQDNMIQFLGTDIHHEKHLQVLKELCIKKEFLSLVSDRRFLNHSLI